MENINRALSHYFIHIRRETVLRCTRNKRFCKRWINRYIQSNHIKVFWFKFILMVFIWSPLPVECCTYISLQSFLYATKGFLFGLWELISAFGGTRITNHPVSNIMSYYTHKTEREDREHEILTSVPEKNVQCPPLINLRYVDIFAFRFFVSVFVKRKFFHKKIFRILY